MKILNKPWFWIAGASVLVVVLAVFMVNRGSLDGPVRHVGPVEASEILKKDKSVILIDVRTLGEFQEGRLKDSMRVEVDYLENLAASAMPDKDKTYLLYCRTGRRSAFAATILERMGYKSLINMTGGIVSWSGQGLPVVR